MIIGSFNIRGGSSALKRRRVNSIIKKGNADIFLIQETKLSNMKEAVAHSFWCHPEIGFSSTDSVGRSGGLITLWRKYNLEVLTSFRGEGYLGIKVRWKDNDYYVVNIYSSCDIVKKKRMWTDLLELKLKFNDGEWIMGGDFNSIKNSRERKGRADRVFSKEDELFADFILLSNLMDVPCKGKKFSWFSGDGRSKSRIDRFLLSSTVVNMWDVVGQMIGDRDISDHCPIWIMTDNHNWGPKPFKFNNEWFSNASFMPFVEKEWKNLVVHGRGDFILKEKLRLIKYKNKKWNKDVFGKIDLETEEGVHDINTVDERLDFDLLSSSTVDDDIVLRKEATGRFWRNLRIKENMLLQRSKLLWLKEGDTNSAFFHKMMKQRRRQNHLGPINSTRGVVESVEDIRE
ncbi:uncharacterized protein LOC131649352 [Vicia villosa]|uniref:uncharacterized protein LOC131649352 n=1 Tax=Vicia villosa TaxID=3911 RepID=UPI00273BFFD8|nr:uncharacterized protein LOC131649352 [Vicia villosa]